MIIVITGPTCSGKSKIAIEVAKALKGEVINADAFAIYKELNIGTAKPSLEERKIVPHHLFDFINPDDRYSIFDYQKDARKIIDNLLEKNIPIIMVGGSGLYIRAALYDYSFEENNVVDTTDYDAYTNEELHEELEKIDPIEASKIHPNNRKRVIRAISIYKIAGKTKTEIIAEQNHSTIYNDVFFYGVDIAKKELHEKIEYRTNKMIEDGLIKEVHDLTEKYGKSLQSLNAIGYKEIIENPNFSTIEVKDLIEKNTKKYAKRQMTFIKHQFDVTWIKDSYELLFDLRFGNINSRSRLLIGNRNMSCISKKKVAIIGIGGVGGTAAESLARSGVGEILLVDSDEVYVTNLNRQILFTRKDIGKKKVKAAKSRLSKINPEIKISTSDLFVDESNIKKLSLEKYDYVVDAIDSMKSKIALIQYLYTNKIPFISSLGMGNRLNPAKVKISTLDKTSYDPLAKKLRNELRKSNINLNNITVAFSEEQPIEKNSSTISSMIFVPSSAGLNISYYVLNSLLEDKNYGTKKN